MLMRLGDLWHCMNPACHCEIVVQAAGEIEGANPRCACGALMKKKYTPPSFTYLEFLRMNESVPEREGSRKG